MPEDRPVGWEMDEDIFKLKIVGSWIFVFSVVIVSLRRLLKIPSFGWSNLCVQVWIFHLDITNYTWPSGNWRLNVCSQLGKHSFSSVLNLIWACCHSEHPPPTLTSLYKWSFPNYSSWKFMTVKVFSFTETFRLPYQFYFAIPFHTMFDEYILRD